MTIGHPDVKKMVALSDRRIAAGKNAKHCPTCDTEQVQLVDWFGEVNRWKCRRCKAKWNTDVVTGYIDISSIT